MKLIPSSVGRCRKNARSAFVVNNRRGAAVVEFAVCAPLLFLLILGMFEVGRFVNVGEIATHASRFGARQASVASATVVDVVARTRQYLNDASVKGSAATITVEAETAAGNGTFAGVTDLSTVAVGSAIRVRVDVDFSQVTWLPGGPLRTILPGTIGGTTVMRKEST
ncbi:pilus assembly protein [bacterium]|jgi:Flp pilus assembly protein TadG|nr:pilus assembly protein [bacterium]